ncbi:MAG TPA: hypothetical protein VMZ52_19795 [Bryobacteraceae bacterium]|nr:hypothetical protein [Bryobacteraceae bacterium]
MSQSFVSVLFATALFSATGMDAGVRVGTFASEVSVFYGKTAGLPSNDVRQVIIRNGQVFALTAAGAARFNGAKWVAADVPADVPLELSELRETAGEIRQVASDAGGRIAVAAMNGLFFRHATGSWQSLQPRQQQRSWAPQDVRGAAFDSTGRLWFASPQGVGSFDGAWNLYTGAEGLPYDDFTSVAAGENGVVWFGTHRGAIRFDGKVWEYRQGLRWLPSDDVRGIAVQPNGDAWFATANGVGRIARRPMTLRQKAKFFEDEIDRVHRRTPYGYVDSVVLQSPGDRSAWTQRDSDNDGLWTAMYGAGECFAYAATQDPLARQRATVAFEALRFLGTVTQGGNHPAPKGFVARTILPAGGPDPNTKDSPAHDAEFRRKRDRLWKLITPRWPLSAGGKWYWKSDTSSDELDGHYFFYANYYDLVAKTSGEKQRVRDHVAAMTDHLIDHDFNLVDHDGKPTRWGIFSPELLNHDPRWVEERSLNSLSILAYLRTAEHITGNAKYREAANTLIQQHSYAMNVLISKTNAGPGSGNQSDDEMAFMSFYCLLKYETDPELRRIFALAFHRRWLMERFELNPLFNFLYASSANGARFQNAFQVEDLSPAGNWLEESIDTLKRYSLDRVNWPIANSHRKDLTPLPEYATGGAGGRGSRRDGRVLPIDERFVDKWNHDPWRLDYAGNGRQLADGASYLLPYYLGLYIKALEE